MHRELIAFPHISTYSFCLLMGFLAGFLLARRNARRRDVPTRHIDNLTLLLVVAGLTGARFFSWLFYSAPGTPFWETMLTPGGGLVFYGGVVFGVLLLITYSALRKLKIVPLFDILAGPLALGLACGRLGCFFAGCCWGDLCVEPNVLGRLDSEKRAQVYSMPLLSRASFPFAVTFPGDTGALREHQRLGLLPGDATRSLPVHPVQLYEAALAFALSMLLQRRFRTTPRIGEVCIRFCVGYGTIRFTLEFFRADNAPGLAGLTLSQWISVAAIAVWLLYRLLTMPRRCEAPADAVAT